MKSHLTKLTACLFSSALSCLAVQENPPKLATLARLDINSSSSVGSLSDGALISGSGSVDRQTWLPTNDWQLTYTIQMPIVRFAWNAFALQFVPQSNGIVQVSLRGPWEEVTVGTGNIYKQEVLWDALGATGVSISNGGFETVNGGEIADWSGGISQAGTASMPAVEGSRMARTWHNDSMNRNLSVTGGVPVILRFFARAYIPTGFADMKPIVQRPTAAHDTARKFMRGVNFGNYMELPSDSQGSFSYTDEDFAQAQSEGFDHVRVPVAWHYYTGSSPEFAIAKDIFNRVDVMVTNALSRGLGVIVDLHNFDEFTKDPPAFADKLYAIWRQVAAHFADAPASLVFEVLNEPRDPATTTVMNPIFAEAIRQIRLTNPGRTVFIGTGAFNGITELNNLILPDNDSNLIATVHTYNPFLFTHQGLPWAGSDAAALHGVVFPGPPAVPLVPAAEVSEWATNWIKNYNTLPTEQNPSGPAGFHEDLQFARQWSEYYGRPVHIGEFGAYSTVEASSRVNYYREMRRALDEFELGWAIWDWKAGFHYWKDSGPDPPGLHDALFPVPVLRMSDKSTVEFEASPGKTFVLERALQLKPAPNWQPLATQLVSGAAIKFTDINLDQKPEAFFRVRWAR